MAPTMLDVTRIRPAFPDERLLDVPDPLVQASQVVSHGQGVGVGARANLLTFVLSLVLDQFLATMVLPDASPLYQSLGTAQALHGWSCKQAKWLTYTNEIYEKLSICSLNEIKMHDFC